MLLCLCVGISAFGEQDDWHWCPRGENRLLCSEGPVLFHGDAGSLRADHSSPPTQQQLSTSAAELKAFGKRPVSHNIIP